MEGSLTIIKLNDNPEYEISNDRDTVNHAETIQKNEIAYLLEGELRIIMKINDEGGYLRYIFFIRFFFHSRKYNQFMGFYVFHSTP